MASNSEFTKKKLGKCTLILFVKSPLVIFSPFILSEGGGGGGGGGAIGGGAALVVTGGAMVVAGAGGGGGEGGKCSTGTRALKLLSGLGGGGGNSSWWTPPCMGGGCWIPFCRCVNPFIKSDSRPVGGGGGGGGKLSRWAEFPRDPRVGDIAFSGGGAVGLTG